MKGFVAKLPEPPSIDDICSSCEFKEECLLAYTIEAYKCKEK